MIGVEHPLKIFRVLYNRLENGEAYNVPGEPPVGHAEEHPFKRLPESPFQKALSPTKVTTQYVY